MESVSNYVLMFLGLATFAAGIWQFRRASKLAAMTPYLTKRLELYGRATEIVGRICASEDEVNLEKSQEEFWTLYYGPMALVEDKAVEKAMVGNCQRKVGFNRPAWPV